MTLCATSNKIFNSTPGFPWIVLQRILDVVHKPHKIVVKIEFAL